MNVWLDESGATSEGGPNLVRRQALLSGFLSLFSALIYFAADFPFPRVIATISLAASACYFLFYLLFELIHRVCYKGAGIFLGVMGVSMLSLVINFSGGIVSPFIFFYFCILISEALYGLDNNFTLSAALAGYLLVVFGQLSGYVPYKNAWAAEVYHSHVATVLIALSTVSYMVLTRYITQILVHNLRGKIEREEQEKSMLLKKFAELNSTSQIGVLAHRIAHDLRGPISSISGYIQMEMAKDKPPEDIEVLKDMNSIITGMSDSLTGITRFGKANAAKAEKIPFSEFMRSLLAILEYAPQSRGVKFVKLYQDKMAVNVFASRSDLQQAYFNILKNAVEAVRDNAEGKVVEIDIKATHKEIEVTISDNGPGIVPEILKMLFKKSITTKKDGTGVGLVITRDLLMRNDGDIELHNREDGGLRVVTRLPVA